MVTIVGLSTCDVTRAQKKNLAEVLERRLPGVFDRWGAYFQYMPVEDVSPETAGQIHFTVLAPPDLPNEAHNAAVKVLREAVGECFGQEKRVMVFFYYNGGNAIAIDGVLAQDAKGA